MTPATGYFRPGDSRLHRRSPITKLLGLGWVLLAAFLLPPAVLVVLAVGLLGLSAATGLLTPLLRSLRIPALLLGSIVVNALFYPRQERPAGLGPFAVTRGLDFARLRRRVWSRSSPRSCSCSRPQTTSWALVPRANHRSRSSSCPRSAGAPPPGPGGAILDASRRGLAVSGSLRQRIRHSSRSSGRCSSARSSTCASGRSRSGARVRGAAQPDRLSPRNDPPIDRWLRLAILAGSIVVVAAATGVLR